MTFCRHFRFITALIALFSMLFMQLAVAAYACPSLPQDQNDHVLSASATRPDQDMPGCNEGQDKAQPSLCHAYDQTGNQSLDKPEPPHVQSFIAVKLPLPLSLVEVSYRPVAAHPESALLSRAAAPPLSIRNCCFRI